MKAKSPNPKAIGAFITAMLLLIVGMVMYFGTASLFNRSTNFILFFDQSVNGLQVGSPVKFRGVPVGQVERIMIRSAGQAEDSTAIPVIIQINRSRLENDLGVSTGAFSEEGIQSALDRGLVGELSLESFITGQLFVEFSFLPEVAEESNSHLVSEIGIREIPTINSSLEDITRDIAKVISDIEALDLAQLNENVNGLLVSGKAVLDGIDSAEISRSITQAANQVTSFVASDEFDKSIASMRGAFEEIRDTAESFNLSDGPLADKVEAWTTQITQTLNSLDTLTDNASAMLDPGSNTRYEFETTLREIGRAARAVKALSEYLERNPSALIKGRGRED